MGKLISFFLAGPTAPARIQVLLIAAAVAAAGVLGLYTWGVYWRGEYREAKAELVGMKAQAEILADSVRACSAGSKAAVAAGVAAVSVGERLLEEAQQLNAGGRRTVAKLDDLLKRKPPAGADCNNAWDDIEKIRSAK